MIDTSTAEIPKSRREPAWDGYFETALVTGAGAKDGIGFAIARKLAQKGLVVFIVGARDRIHRRAEELRAQHLSVTSLVSDLTNAVEVSRLREHVGAIDIPINNAGMGSVTTPAVQRQIPGFGRSELGKWFAPRGGWRQYPAGTKSLIGLCMSAIH